MTEYPDIEFKKSSVKYDWFELVQPCKFEHITGQTIVIPAGYTTDFASVPQPLWWLIPPNGRSVNPSVVHDYLYDNRIGTRKEADLFFLKELKNLVPLWQAYTMFYFVRIFAGSWWKK